MRWHRTFPRLLNWKNQLRPRNDQNQSHPTLYLLVIEPISSIMLLKPIILIVLHCTNLFNHINNCIYDRAVLSEISFYNCVLHAIERSLDRKEFILPNYVKISLYSQVSISKYFIHRKQRRDKIVIIVTNYNIIRRVN